MKGNELMLQFCCPLISLEKIVAFSKLASPRYKCLIRNSYFSIKTYTQTIKLCPLDVYDKVMSA